MRSLRSPSLQGGEYVTWEKPDRSCNVSLNRRAQVPVSPTRAHVNSRRPYTGKTALKGEFDANLCGERDADSSAGAEEVSQGPGRDKQLLAARDRHGAVSVRAKCGDVREIVYGNGQRADVAHVVVPGIVAIKKVEEFDEGRKRPALLELDGAAHAQIGLQVRRAAELVESTLHAIDHRAATDRSRQRDRPRGLVLREKGEVETRWRMNRSGKNKTMPDVLARWTIISRGEGVERIANAVHIIEKLTDLASPGFCAG